MDNSENYNRAEVKKLLVLATLAGRIMLKSGAETYRVEDTVIRICKSRKNIQYVDAFVIPTGIFISLDYNGELMSYIKRIKTISINLNKIDLVNEFSRAFVSSGMPIDDGLEELKRINKVSSYSPLTKAAFGSMAAAFFCILYNGTIFDSIASFLVSFLVLSALNVISRFKLPFFINNFVGAILASILAYLSLKIGIGDNLDKIIIGSIIPLFTGVAFTNAIRDTMSGDFLSGLSRGMEAVFSTLAIAIGVGIMLNFYLKGGF
ncbi:threonine/serine exporter family protein [Tissierella sp.]|uniref:threonine/serine exporter family protein n=1 Tax=Tissierella sp. TaxID=41274 RepID=UPI002855D966|nr:threonine/serine exporter family protein [Tissierella sp.]MDR7856417.1 threonine/serine exporter family protein [Tissierella sp.]